MAPKIYQFLSLLFLGLGSLGCVSSQQSPRNSLTDRDNGPTEFWLTSPGENILFEKQSTLQKSGQTTAQPTILEIDANKIFQTMEGFGYTLTGGSAIVINLMAPAARQKLLEEFFGSGGKNLGVSYLRISIGASDLSERVFSYNDLPAGQTDSDMQRFSLEPERKDFLPVLKQVLSINPEIKIMATPWSPPAWMKTNGKTKGGSLKPEWYDAYAQYLVKYVQAMKKEGIAIDAMTIQNEPLHPGNNPSMLMLPEEQSAFIKNHLGPAFRKAGINTKIIIYDHNADRPDYPLTILGEPEARQYVDGTAFHLYGGNIEALSQVHDAFPEKHIYFTEQWVGAPGNLAGDMPWHVENLIIGATRNWARTVLEWNLAADPKQEPHTEGGCTQCLGAVTIHADDRVTRNPAYYIIAHAAKFVRPGSVRIASTASETLPNVAFKTPARQIVLIVLNKSSKPQSFAIKGRGYTYEGTLAAGAVGTFVTNL